MEVLTGDASGVQQRCNKEYGTRVFGIELSLQVDEEMPPPRGPATLIPTTHHPHPAPPHPTPSTALSRLIPEQTTTPNPSPNPTNTTLHNVKAKSRLTQFA